MKNVKIAGIFLLACLMALTPLTSAAADEGPGGFDCKYYNEDIYWYFFDWYGVLPEDCIKDPEARTDVINNFEVVAGQKVIAYRGSCTITTESAYASTTISMANLRQAIGTGAPHFIASGCSVNTNGVLGDTTILTYAINNRTFYDKFSDGRVSIWYADGAGSWAPCTTAIYGADLEAEGGAVFGVASCTIVGAVTAFGPGEN